MEQTLIKGKGTESAENKDNLKGDIDGDGGSGSKRAKNGVSCDFGKSGRSFDPDTILLAKKPQLTIKDVECPICMAILYEPTTLPCNHSLCTACFLQHAEETSLYCPICRRRLSVWSRKAKKRNELLDKELWIRLKNEFPQIIAARENGDSQEVLGSEVQVSQPSVRDGVISDTPGAIFDELKNIIKPHEEDLEKQRRQAEAASMQLIKKLQEEEMKKLDNHKKIEEEDHRLAKRLQEEDRRKNRGIEVKSRKSERIRVPCRLFNEYWSSLDSSVVKRKCRPKKRILPSSKEENIKMDSSKIEQVRADSTAAVPNDDFHIQENAKGEPMETEIIDIHERSTVEATVCPLEQLPGSLVQDAMKVENGNYSDCEAIVSALLTRLDALEQSESSMETVKTAKELKLNDNHDWSSVAVPLSSIGLLEHTPGLFLAYQAVEADNRTRDDYQFPLHVPLTKVDLPEQLPDVLEETTETELNDDIDQSTVPVPMTCVEFREQSPVSSLRESKAENDGKNEEDYMSYVINIDQTKQSQDLLQHEQIQVSSTEVVEPDPISKKGKPKTIQFDITVSSALYSFTSKDFNVSGLSYDDEIIPPSDCEDEGEELPTDSRLSLCFDTRVASSDDDDRMSLIIDYEVEEEEAAAWNAFRRRLEQEAEDRAYALSLQRDIKLGIDSSRSRRKESENKYALRTWTRSQKKVNDISTRE